jgi:trans-aconitate methyltransferase
VDSSPDFIQAAQKLGLDARLMDAEDLHFNAEFDAVFSNAALHWMKQLDQVLAGVFRALKPGGRFVSEMGGKGNIDQIEMATHQALARRSLTGVVPHPNFYPSEKQFQSLLENQGFKVGVLKLFDRPTPLPGDLKAWLKTFRKSYLELLDPQDLPVFLEEIQESLRPRLCNPHGQWVADYVRLRFSAFKPL